MLLVPTELRSSPIQGVGVFLLVPVKKGEAITRFDPRIDRVMSHEAFDSLPDLAKEFVRSYAPWNKATTLRVIYGDNNRFCNHSDTPSMIAPDGPFGGEIATRDLEIGDELTSDYRMLCDVPFEMFKD